MYAKTIDTIRGKNMTILLESNPQYGFIYKRKIFKDYGYSPLKCHDEANALLYRADKQLLYCGTWCAEFICANFKIRNDPKRLIKIACGKGFFHQIIDYNDLIFLYNDDKDKKPKDKEIENINQKLNMRRILNRKFS